MKARNWIVFVISGFCGCILLLSTATVIIDPFFHYHGPLSFLEYPCIYERYQNDGLARHMEYDAIITGTSMTQNFKCSEFDEFWETNSIKLSYSGASFHEINANLRRAFSYNPNVRYVLTSLDGNLLNYPADKDTYSGYPEYFFDNNPFNDVNYLLNKEIVPKTIAVVNYTRAGNRTLDRDEYSRWNQYKTFGYEAVINSFELIALGETEYKLSDEERIQITDNITDNYIQTALDNPDVEFYLFYPPYSVCYWEALQRSKQLQKQIDVQRLATELLLEVDNIHVYDFNSQTEITGDLNNYCDTLHYGEWINSEILKQIFAGESELTKDNYERYYKELQELYENYDYSLYKLFAVTLP